jgi:hypothetical protein
VVFGAAVLFCVECSEDGTGEAGVFSGTVLCANNNPVEQANARNITRRNANRILLKFPAPALDRTPTPAAQPIPWDIKDLPLRVRMSACVPDWVRAERSFHRTTSEFQMSTSQPQIKRPTAWLRQGNGYVLWQDYCCAYRQFGKETKAAPWYHGAL